MNLFLILALCAFVIYWLLVKPLTYWKNKGIPQFSVSKLLWENVKSILQLYPMVDSVTTMYNGFPNARYCGVYQIIKPILLIKDPELIKQVTVKDFEYFVDRSQFANEDDEPLFGKNLASLKGERWKDMRATLSPSFTSSKMKIMFCLMSECADNFTQHFQNKNSEIVVVELKDIFTKYTNDIIASVSFGITCDSMKDPENKFYLMGKQVANFGGFWRTLSILLKISAPRLAKFLGIKLFSNEVTTFFSNIVKNNMAEREQKGIVRPDMIHLLMQAKKGTLKHEENNQTQVDAGFAVIEESSIGKEEKRQKRQLTDDDIIAQALMFFLAGFESVSILISFTLYELAINPLIQQKLQEEVDNALMECNGTITYEILMKMQYLDMVISETLRKWLGNAIIDRICVKPYTIQPVNESESPIQVNVGDSIGFSLYSIQRDEKYFPNPDCFDPERFSAENKVNIVPYTFIPFGVGPRSCIANRFALLETKILLFHVMKNLDIVVVEKSVVPVRLSPKNLNPTAQDGFWFGLKPRKRYD